MTRRWPTDARSRVLARQVEFSDHMLRDAIVMAMYIRGMDRPVFLDADIEHCKSTFNVEFERWEKPK